MNAEPSISNPAERMLKKFMVRDREYLVFIGIPLNAPDHWLRVRAVEAREVICEGDLRFPVSDVISCLVAYPNGEILEAAKVFMPLPDGIDFIKSREEVIEDTLDLNELTPGQEYIRVLYGPPKPSSKGAQVYSTRLVNISKERVRILRFGGYSFMNGKWKLHTINGGYFSAEQFRAWYGLGDSEWMMPGAAVEDPENYGGPHAVWAYFCETESGKKFVAGAETP